MTEENILLKGLKPEQHAAICDTTSENSVVAAGAGSGKTFVLARRYAYLVVEKGIPVDKILTLTFTKKAAAEMYQRIHDMLAEVSAGLTGEAKHRAEKALAEFSKAHIQTLDSFCSTIIKNAVHHYGIKPDYTVDKDMLELQIKAAALPFVLSHMENAALQELNGTYSPKNLADSIFTKIMLDHTSIIHQIQFDEDLARQSVEIQRQWEEAGYKAENLLQRFTQVGLKLKTPLKDPVFTCPAVLFPAQDEQAQQKAVTDFLLTLFEHARVTKPKAGTAPEKEAVVEGLRECYPQMTAMANFICRWPVLKAMNPLLKEFQEQCTRIKRTQGLLTFADAADLAVDVLLHDRDLRNSQKNAYSVIMIDEFQDNNSLQRDMLYLLAEKPDVFTEGIPAADDLVPGKLFFVGDEKQSIYKFRGADVSVFRKLADELPKNLPLSLNFRSHPALIAAFNTICGSIPYPADLAESLKVTDPDPNLPAIFNKAGPDQPLEAYDAGYSATNVPDPEKKADSSYEPRVHVCMIHPRTNDADDDVLSDIESEAIWTAAEIKRLLSEGASDGKKYSPQDIAILFKTTTNQKVFERYLRLAGIPYASEAVSGFFEDAPVNDMLSILRYLVYPNDRLAYAAMLKSPFVRLSDNAVRAVLSGSPIAPEEQARLDDATTKLDALARRIETMTVAETVSTLWYEFGLQYETRWNQTVLLYSELYDFLYELACRADQNGKTLIWFTDYLATLKHSSRKLDDMDIPLERAEAVHLMTIHKSKGLQFPVVFICNTAGKPNNADARQSAFFSDRWGFTLNTSKLPGLPETSTMKTKNNIFIELGKKENDLKDEAELRRVLYVALTRAKDLVYVTGNNKGTFEPSASQQSEGHTAKNLYSLLRPLFQHFAGMTGHNPFCFHEQERYTRSESYDILQISDNADYIPNTAEARSIIARKGADLYEKAAVPEVPVTRKHHISASLLHQGLETAENAAPSTSQNSASDSRILPDVPEFKANHFGTLVHACVESLFTGTQPEVPKSVLALLTEPQLETVMAQGMEMARAFMKTELAQKALAARWRRNEYSFKMQLPATHAATPALGGQPGTEQVTFIEGQIDLFFETEENGEDVLYIVDFKTDREEKPEIHVPQLACYSLAARQMRPLKGADGGHKKTRSWLYYLRSGHSIEITDAVEAVSLQSLVAQKLQQPPQPQ